MFNASIPPDYALTSKNAFQLAERLFSRNNICGQRGISWNESNMPTSAVIRTKMIFNTIRFASYKQRKSTDVFCLVLFIVFLGLYGLVSAFAISQANPRSLIQPSDSFGNLCGQKQFHDRPYQLYYDISQCLTDRSLSLICPTTKLCVQSCPTYYSHYQSLQAAETSGSRSRNDVRRQLICTYGYQPASDNRSISEIVQGGFCAPYTVASEPFLGRCLPSVFTSLFDYQMNHTSTMNLSLVQMIGISNVTDVSRVIASDLDRIKESLALFILVGFILVMFYMLALRELTGFIVLLTTMIFLGVLFIISLFCWYTIYTGQDLVYDYSVVARIINDFIRLRTVYYIVGGLATFFLALALFVLCASLNRLRLSIALLEQGANAVFSIMSTLLWSPLILVLFLLLTLGILYIQVCFSTVGKPIFRMMVNNRSVPCSPQLNSTQCLFQQEYGYDSFALNGTDRFTRAAIEFLVDNRTNLKWLNLFAYVWMGSFLFAFEQTVLAGVFSHYYWSKARSTTSWPLFYSLIIVLRYHLGSIAFGSLLITLLKHLRIILDYLKRKLGKLPGCTLIIFPLRCCFWLFEKFLQFLNTNSYILIATRGYSFCKATRQAFVYISSNCFRFLVLINLTDWILFCGTISICTCNTYLFYAYLRWTHEFDRLILHWTPLVVMALLTYLICRVFFNVYHMAIKTFFLCFLQDLDENDGSIACPDVMNNELLRLVHKTNVVEKE